MSSALSLGDVPFTRRDWFRAAGSVLFHRTQLPESVPGWLLPGGKKTVVSGAGDGNVDDDRIIIMEPSS